MALARAMYARCSVLLLDDVLSAVDAHVGAHIFKQCLCGALRGSTRIMSTHQVHFLDRPVIDQVVVMENGRVHAKGTYEELVASGAIDTSAWEVKTQEEDKGNPRAACSVSRSVSHQSSNASEREYACCCSV